MRSGISLTTSCRRLRLRLLLRSQTAEPPPHTPHRSHSVCFHSPTMPEETTTTTTKTSTSGGMCCPSALFLQLLPSVCLDVHSDCLSPELSSAIPFVKFSLDWRLLSSILGSALLIHPCLEFEIHCCLERFRFTVWGIESCETTPCKLSTLL